jgi:hypothetical protein
VIRIIHDIAKFPLAGIVFFVVSGVALAFWEVLRLTTPPSSGLFSIDWDLWRRWLPPVAIVTTTLAILLMGLRFAFFSGLI